MKKCKDVLRERALKLAPFKKGVDEIGSTVDGVSFNLGEETYLIEFDFISEICPLSKVVSIPSVPKFIYGLINIRSKVITVINLKECFGFEPHQPKACNKVICIENDQASFAILVDNIVSIVSIPEKDIQIDLPALKGVGHEMLKGFTTGGIVILDGQKILTLSMFKIEEKVG